MSYLDLPPGQRVLQEFKVFRDTNGYWVVAETHGLPGGLFACHDEAVRFALRQADRDFARVHVEPTAAPRRPVPVPRAAAAQCRQI